MPQILALMVDLEDDPEWTVADEIDEDDSDRFFLYTTSDTCKLFFQFKCKTLLGSILLFTRDVEFY